MLERYVDECYLITFFCLSHRRETGDQVLVNELSKQDHSRQLQSLAHPKEKDLMRERVV